MGNNDSERTRGHGMNRASYTMEDRLRDFLVLLLTDDEARFVSSYKRLQGRGGVRGRSLFWRIK